MRKDGPRPTSTRLLILAAAVFLTVGLALLGTSRGAGAAADKSISGRILSHQVTGTACTSPVALCTSGEFTGGLKGTFDFTATSVTATADTPTTSVLQYTGDIVLHTKTGDLTFKDAGVFATTGDGELGSVSHITGGTGSLAGTTGRIRISGTFKDGVGDSAYEGRVRFP